MHVEVQGAQGLLSTPRGLSRVSPPRQGGEASTSIPLASIHLARCLCSLHHWPLFLIYAVDGRGSLIFAGALASGQEALLVPYFVP